MKVVLLKSGVKNSGGLEKTASRIAHAFRDLGVDVSIVTTVSKKGFLLPRVSADIPVHVLKSFSSPSLLRIWHYDKQVQKWLKDNPADVVFGLDRNKYQTHIRAGNGVHAAYLKSRIFPEGHLKYTACLFNPLHQQILRLEKQAFENPRLKKIFTNSHMVKEEILDRFSVEPSKISVIHNGVEWEEMRADFALWPEQKLKACQSFHLDPDQFHFLFVGHGFLRKGLGQLLKAMHFLKRKDIHLSVVGKDRNASFYEAQANKLGLQLQVRFFGAQSDIRLFYQFADALVIPSFYDPFANVTIEALAMGLYVISSKSNGGSEVLTPQTGTIIEDLQSIESITDALEKAISNRKTIQSAVLQRNSVQSLNYQTQLKKITEACLA